MCTSRTSKPARLRFKPPGPSAESRRSCVSIESGFVWSTTCESSPRPKKYSIAAEMLLGLMSVRGDISATSLRLIRSCTVRRSFRKPLRSSSLASSSIVRRRRLPRWSMSSTSTWPSPSLSCSMYLIAAIRSSGRSVISVSGTESPSLRLIRKRPTRPRRYRFVSLNFSSNSVLALSRAGGLPGRSRW